MSKIIQVVVSPTGETKIETTGFTGSSCQEASRALEQALGAKTGETLTGEYYAASNEQTTELQN
jgi:hypothetical protein